MTPNGIPIRKANIGDLDAIKALADANKSSLGFIIRPTLSFGIQKGWILVAESKDHRVIGFVHYRHRQDSQTTLYEICVDETQRGNGVGRSLIEMLSAEAAALGKEYIRLKAPVNLPANRFYQIIGFNLVGVIGGKRRQLNIWEIRLSNGKVV